MAMAEGRRVRDRSLVDDGIVGINLDAGKL